MCLRIANANVDLVQEKGQLLENVFADPKGFGVSPEVATATSSLGFPLELQLCLSVSQFVSIV